MNFATETNISDIAYALEQTLGPMQHAKILNIMRGRWAVQTDLHTIFTETPARILWCVGAQHGIDYDTILDAYARAKKIAKAFNAQLDAALDAREELHCRMHDCTDPVTRRRLTPTAILLFFRISSVWCLNDYETKILLGGVTHKRLRRLSLCVHPQLSQDAFIRVLCLISYFHSLNTAYFDDLDGWWMKLPNPDQPFEGDTPLHYILEGGLTALNEVREILQAQATEETMIPLEIDKNQRGMTVVDSVPPNTSGGRMLRVESNLNTGASGVHSIGN